VVNVLVTGAGGFIGSHLAEECVRQGYKVKAFLRYNSKNDWGWLELSDYKDDIEIFTGDIRDYDSVYDAMRDCNAVFHLAALVGIPYSYFSPLAYIKTNIVGTYNVLQAAKDLKTEDILITSTSETYGTAQYVPIDEKHPLVGQSPYSGTKIAADQLAISYYCSFNLPIKIVRPFNTYGPRQSARAIIPTIITQILSGNGEVNLGNLTATRDLTYVSDTVAGFIEIYKSKKLYQEVINIGMKHEVSVGKIAKLISDLMGFECKIKSESTRIRPDSSEVERLICDNSKILNNTNWKPRYDLKSGLIETIEWFRKNFTIYKSYIYNI